MYRTKVLLVPACMFQLLDVPGCLAACLTQPPEKHTLVAWIIPRQLACLPFASLAELLCVTCHRLASPTQPWKCLDRYSRLDLPPTLLHTAGSYQPWAKCGAGDSHRQSLHISSGKSCISCKSHLMLLPFVQVCCCQSACTVCCAAQLLVLQFPQVLLCTVALRGQAFSAFCYCGQASWYIRSTHPLTLPAVVLCIPAPYGFVPCACGACC